MKNNNPYVSIFTATYNRAHTLPRLVESLTKQSSKEFEWVIVDDGSIDNTREYIESIKDKVEFDICYVFKKNEGKHIAINVGAQHARGKLFFMVDSDDFLHEEAIETIIKIERTIDKDAQFAGVAGLKGDIRGNPIKSPTENYSEKEINQLIGQYIDLTPLEYRYKRKISGDRAEVVYTKVIKDIPFPNITDEKFMEESYLWMNISNRGLKFRWFNTVIYLCEYLQDGLTYSMKELVKNNWKNHCFCANYELSIKEIPFNIRMARCLRYYRYGLYGNCKIRELWSTCNDKLLSLFVIPIALVYRVK